MSATDKAYKNARRMRRELSLPEKLLWIRLRGCNVRFRRQHRIGPFVRDFSRPARKLAIEVDGAEHDFGDRPRRDDARQTSLRANVIELLRLCAQPLHRSSAPSGPPPHAFGAGRSE